LIIKRGSFQKSEFSEVEGVQLKSSFEGDVAKK
jgi:hypothetical protein